MKENEEGNVIVPGAGARAMLTALLEQLPTGPLPKQWQKLSRNELFAMYLHEKARADNLDADMSKMRSVRDGGYNVHREELGNAHSILVGLLSRSPKVKREAATYARAWLTRVPILLDWYTRLRDE